MYAPVALRFHSYAIKLDAVSSAYVDSVLQHADVISWMVAGRQESEVIAAAEI
jgi:glutathione S-transferase